MPPNIPKTRHAGRKSSFTKTIGKKICKAVAKGVPQAAAARAVGVSPKTVSSWYYKGCDALDEGKENDYSEFSVELEKAKGLAVQHRIENINRVAEGYTKKKVTIGPDGETITEEDVAPDWRANAHMLECMGYGPKKKIEHSGTVNHQSVNLNVQANIDAGKVSELAGLLGKAIQKPQPANIPLETTSPDGAIETEHPVE